MSLIPEIPEGQLCERCNLHKATLISADDVMSYVHGFLRMWCQCCHLDVEIKRVEKAMESYPRLLKDLDAACRDEVPMDPKSLVAEISDLRRELRHQWEMAHYHLCIKRHYTAMAANAPHRNGEHCYWPEPVMQ